MVRAISFAPISASGFPVNEIIPVLGSTRERARNNVDFPQAFGPTITVISPRGMAIFTLSIIGLPPYPTRRFSPDKITSVFIRVPLS